MSNKQCVNCPGATDHSTAECPVVREQSKIDAERAAFETEFEGVFFSSCFEREDDGSYAGRGLQGAWLGWQKARSLPAGVPDGYALVPSPSSCGDAWTNNKPDREGAYWIRGNGLEQPALIQVKMGPDELECNLHMSTTEPNFGYGYTISQLNDDFEWLGPLTTAAPTVKGEQVQCDECGGNGAGDDHEDDCSKATSLLAAGSAGEEVEQARFIEWATSEYQVRPDEDLNLRHKDVVENRKGWLARAALSAQQSEPERVSVPVELLERSIRHMEWFGKSAAKEVDELRALLASHGQAPQINGVEPNELREAVKRFRAANASHGRGEA